jgi:hypothetical protein
VSPRARPAVAEQYLNLPLRKARRPPRRRGSFGAGHLAYHGILGVEISVGHAIEHLHYFAVRAIFLRECEEPFLADRIFGARERSGDLIRARLV